MLDPSLTMGPHTKTLSKSCFHHIRSFRQIRSFVDHSTAISVSLALVSSRLDYVNSILSGSPLKHIACLQCAQRTLPSYFSFYVITYHLVHGLSTSLPRKFGIPYPSHQAIAITIHFQTSSKDTLLPVSLSCHLVSIHQLALILFIHFGAL